MSMLFYPFHKTIKYLLCPFVKDDNSIGYRVSSEEKMKYRLRVAGYKNSIEYRVYSEERGKKRNASRWYLVFSI